MCVYSMVAQDWSDRNPQWSTGLPTYTITTTNDAELRKDIDELRKELTALKELLKAAKIYDESTNQKDCEDAEKVALFRRLAELSGVSMDDVFPEAVK